MREPKYGFCYAKARLAQNKRRAPTGLHCLRRGLKVWRALSPAWRNGRSGCPRMAFATQKFGSFAAPCWLLRSKSQQAHALLRRASGAPRARAALGTLTQDQNCVPAQRWLSEAKHAPEWHLACRSNPQLQKCCIAVFNLLY